MDVMIVEEHRTESRVSFELSCGKKSAYVSYGLVYGDVDVCVNNASHRAWRGIGKCFASFTDAFNNYKSAEVRAMIEFLRDAVPPECEVAT